MSFSGGFGTVSIGERFDTGAAMLSRLTAGVPTGEPDGGQIGAFYTSDSIMHMAQVMKLIMQVQHLKLYIFKRIWWLLICSRLYTNSGENGTN